MKDEKREKAKEASRTLISMCVDLQTCDSLSVETFVMNLRLFVDFIESGCTEVPDAE